MQRENFVDYPIPESKDQDILPRNMEHGQVSASKAEPNVLLAIILSWSRQTSPSTKASMKGGIGEQAKGINYANEIAHFFTKKNMAG